jgi:O-antigen/teichoic acid export membrane protein
MTQLRVPARRRRPGGSRSGSMTGNALGMLSGRVAAMGLGFVFWLVAAHVATSREVGFAAAVVSAMMLCTQFGQLGVGSAFISLSRDHAPRPGVLLDVALTVTGIGSVIVAAVFLVAARTWLPELGQVSRTPSWTVAFLVMSVLGTAGIVLDQINVALGRGHQVLVRTAAFGLITLVPVAALPALGLHANAMLLFSFWLVAGVGALAVGMWQLWASTPPASESTGVSSEHRAYGYQYRPRLQPALVRRVLTVGLANHVLTLCERVPGLVLPVVVTELLSAEANAVWYIVWMSAWVVFTAPISVGIALFAEAVRLPESTARATATALRTSLLYAGTAAAGLALLAHPVLRLLGRHYAAAGVTPLRILLIGVVPLAVVSAYFAQCRARGRLTEAIAAGTVAGVGGVVVPAAIGVHHGLIGIAAAWVAVQGIVACWAGVRLWSASR